MKKFSTILTAMTLVFTGMAADAASCKYKQNKTDDFTGEPLVKVDWVEMTGWASSTFKRTIGGRKDIEIAAEHIDGRSLLKFRLKLSDAVQDRPDETDLMRALYVPVHSTAEITMADESRIELVVDDFVQGTNRAKYDEGWWVVTSKFTVRYPLDDEIAERLATGDVMYLRLSASSHQYDFVNEQGSIEFNLNDKAQKAFQKALGCLQQAVNKGAS